MPAPPDSAAITAAAPAEGDEHGAFLDEEQRSFFEAHGFLIVRGVVSAERVAELGRALDAIYTASPPPRKGEVWELPGISRGSPEIARHAADATIARLAAEALGCARIQLLQDTALVKPARGGATVAWHQDHTYTGYLTPARVITARLALTDCTVENGCMEVVDGSHAASPEPLSGSRALSALSVADALGARAEALADRVVAIELAPGDISLHHCLTFHRSGENRGEHARKTLITRLFDARCTLRPEALPAHAASYFPVDEAGHLATSSFPVLWPAPALR